MILKKLIFKVKKAIATIFQKNTIGLKLIKQTNYPIRPQFLY